MKKAKDPNFDAWAETWDGTRTLFNFYWKSKRSDNGFPDYVRENMTVDEIVQQALIE